MARTEEKSKRPSQSEGSQILPGLVLLCCTLGAAFQIWLLWFSKIPLGVPREWTWPRIPVQYVSQFEPLPSLLTGLAFLAYLVWSCRSDLKRPRTLFWLSGLLLLGFGWVLTIGGATSLGGGLGRSVFVMYYPRTSGYYHQARYEARDLGKFLKEYETQIRDESNPENSLHIGTHPPGLTTLHRLLIEFCKDNPGFAKFLDSTQPNSVTAAIQFIDHSSSRILSPTARAENSALWLAILLSQFVAVLTVIPLYFLALRVGSVGAARCIAGSWLFVPALLVFLPKSDAFFPFFAMLLQWMWINALEKNSRLLGMLTAILFTFAATLSLAFFTVGAILFSQLILAYIRHRRGLRPLISGLITGVLCVGLIRILLDFNLFNIWLQNYHNHARFYAHNPRSDLTWLGVNSLEAAFAVGLPMALCAVPGFCFFWQARYRTQASLLLGIAVWGLLWVSGKNMGEAARLWLFLMPYALLATAPIFDRLLESNSWTQHRLLPAIMLTLQAVVSLLTVMRVDGFGLTDI